MGECLFCAIEQGRLPASIFYEDEHCVAFMDLYPFRQGHALVIPRRHAVHLHELESELQQHLFAVACRVLRAQQRAGLPWEGANVMVNDGPAAGQHVPHVHIHLVPRVRGDRLRVLGHLIGRVVNVFGRAQQRARLDAVAARLRARME